MARESGRAICDQTGATSEIIAESRAELLAEQDSEFRRTPLMVGRGPGGQRTVRPNPYHAGNPQPYQPAAPVPHGGVSAPPPAAGPGQTGFLG
jgi:hypothetical protein